MLRSPFVVALLFLSFSPAAAQSPPPSQPSPTTVDASKGGVTISSGPNSLTIGARVQFRWTLDDREDASTDIVGDGVGVDDGALSQFDVPRMRLSFTGGAFRPWLRYGFQFEFSRTSGESASKIKDAVIEIRPVGRSYRVSAGQFKAPFGLQQLTSSGRLQFVDRAITDAKFNPSREMGLMFGGSLAGRKVGYDAGVFNGSGEAVRQNNSAHLWVGRVYFQPLGPYVLSEGGSDAGPAVLHLGIAARTGKQIRGRTTAGVVDEPDDQTAYDAEFAYKGHRLFATAEYFWMTDEQQIPVAGSDIHSRGFHAQAGYMLMPRRAELAVLIAQVSPDIDVDEADLSEFRGVLSYYFSGHGLKFQGDAGIVRYDAAFSQLSLRARQGLPPVLPRLASGVSVSDTQVRVQLQLAF